MVGHKEILIFTCFLLGVGLLTCISSLSSPPPPDAAADDDPPPPPPPPPPAQQQPRGSDAYSMAIFRGDSALRGHDLKEARDAYSAAIKLDPSQLEAYSKRAVVWLSLQRHEKAAADLSEVLRAKPGDAKSLLTRANCLAAVGDFDAALADLDRVAALDSGNDRAAARRLVVQQAAAAARQLRQLRAGDDALPLLDQVLGVATHSRPLLLQRARLQLERGDYRAAETDTAVLIKAKHDDADAYCLRGEALFRGGDHDTAGRHFREALKFDPDHRHCRAAWKQLKAVVKAVEQFDADVQANRCADAVARAAELLALVGPELAVYRQPVLDKRCTCLSRLRNAADGLPACDAAIAADPHSVAAYLGRAELHIVQSDYARALADYNAILRFDANNAQAHEGVQRVHKLEQLLRRKDYYKILGVSRDATAKEIKAAYRELLFIWHPDKNPPEKREEASAKFRDIKDAYDVLLDEDKRAVFDRGEDPLDARAQHQQHHPFAHPFHGFPGGGGFQFRWG